MRWTEDYRKNSRSMHYFLLQLPRLRWSGVASPYTPYSPKLLLCFFVTAEFFMQPIEEYVENLLNRSLTHGTLLDVLW